MFARLVHFSVSFIHFDKAGIMDGFHAFDCYSFSEKRAIKRCTKKFKKLHAIEFISVPERYYNSWQITCEVI